MKSNTIILSIIAGFLMLGMMVTNPSTEDHRKEVGELLRKTVSERQFLTSSDNSQTKKQLEAVLIGTRIINTSIDRTNMILFSLTKMQVGASNNTIGVGIFGSVILFNQTGYQLAWQIEQQAEVLEKTRTSPKKKIEKTLEPPYIEDESTSNYGVGNYRPNASDYNRVYFHNRPDYSSRRNAYLVTQDIVYVERIQNGFGYVRFTNDRGQVTTGWLDMAELTPY